MTFQRKCGGPWILPAQLILIIKKKKKYIRGSFIGTGGSLMYPCYQFHVLWNMKCIYY